MEKASAPIYTPSIHVVLEAPDSTIGCDIFDFADIESDAVEIWRSGDYWAFTDGNLHYRRNYRTYANHLARRQQKIQREIIESLRVVASINLPFVKI